MFVQAAGFALALGLLRWPLLAGIASAVALGIGTAMVYPALIAVELPTTPTPAGGPTPWALTASGATSATPPAPDRRCDRRLARPARRRGHRRCHHRAVRPTGSPLISDIPAHKRARGPDRPRWCPRQHPVRRIRTTEAILLRPKRPAYRRPAGGGIIGIDEGRVEGRGPPGAMPPRPIPGMPPGPIPPAPMPPCPCGRGGLEVEWVAARASQPFRGIGSGVGTAGERQQDHRGGNTEHDVPDQEGSATDHRCHVRDLIAAGEDRRSQGKADPRADSENDYPVEHSGQDQIETVQFRLPDDERKGIPYIAPTIMWTRAPTTAGLTAK